MVRTVSRVLSLVLLLAACGGKSPPPAPPPQVNACPAAPRLIEMEEFGRLARKCDDDACRAALRAQYADAYVSVAELLAIGDRKAQEATSRALAELQALETRSCACKDAGCAEGVQEDFEAWAKRHADTKGSQAAADQAGQIAEAISACMVKAMATPAPKP